MSGRSTTAASGLEVGEGSRRRRKPVLRRFWVVLAAAWSLAGLVARAEASNSGVATVRSGGASAAAAGASGRHAAGRSAVRQTPSDLMEDTLRVAPFGKVTVYRQTAHPGSVVLFLSGDGGWNLGVVDMARELSRMDAMVIGIDFPRYLKVLEASGTPCRLSGLRPGGPRQDHRAAI